MLQSMMCRFCTAKARAIPTGTFAAPKLAQYMMPQFQERRPEEENLCDHVDKAGGLGVGDVQEFLSGVWRCALFDAGWDRNVAEEMNLVEADYDD